MLNLISHIKKDIKRNPIGIKIVVFGIQVTFFAISIITLIFGISALIHKSVKSLINESY